MGSYAVPVTLSQKIFIVKSYYKLGESPEMVQEQLQRRYRIELDNVHDVDLLDQVIATFEATGSVADREFYYTGKAPQSAVVESIQAKPEIQEKVKRELVQDVQEEELTTIEEAPEEGTEDEGVANEVVVNEVVDLEEITDDDTTMTATGESQLYCEEVESPQMEQPSECSIEVIDMVDDDEEEPPAKHVIITNYRRPAKRKLTVKANTVDIPTKVSNKEHLPTVWICNICGKVSKQKRIHKTHMLVHSDERPHQCTECPMAFVRLQGLKRHLLTHTGEKPYVCEVCGLSFAAYMSHQMHVRLHTGERPYECRHCGDKFIGLPALNNHLKSHDGEYTYYCRMCSSRFKTDKTLEDHVRKKHAHDITVEDESN